MDPDKKKLPKEPKNDPPQGPRTEKPVPPEREPVKEPEVGPEIKPELPDIDLPGKENIPPIRAFISRLETGYW